MDAPIKNLVRSYPGYAISRGDRGENVATIQTAINRISTNYPSIPKMYPVDGIFGEATERSVKQFQRIFNLTPDGIVGKATWYKMISLYTGITRLSELNSEGQTIFGRSLEYPDAISEGNRGEKVIILQFFINVIASVNPFVPAVPITGTFGPETKNAVIAFQQNNGLATDGIVGAKTWGAMYDDFKGIVDRVFLSDTLFDIQTKPYPGEALTSGSTGDNVRTIQQYLNAISVTNPGLPAVEVTGVYDNATRRAVTQYQQAFDLPVTGEVDEETWNSIANTYKNVISATLTRPDQFPGVTLKLGDSDKANTSA